MTVLRFFGHLAKGKNYDVDWYGLFQIAYYPTHDFKDYLEWEQWDIFWNKIKNFRKYREKIGRVA